MENIEEKIQEDLNNYENLINDLIKYLKEHHPYPEDIFCKKIGKAARAGYNACIYNIEKYLEELQEE